MMSKFSISPVEIQALENRKLFAIAAASNVAALNATPTAVTVTWKDNATNETSYRVEKQTTNNGAWSTVATVAANKTSVAVTQADRTAIRYRVFALGSGTTTSASSDTVIAVTGGTVADAITVVKTNSTTVTTTIAGKATAFTVGDSFALGVFGRAGADSINTTSIGRGVRIEGAAGNDTIKTGGGGDYIVGGDGNDSVEAGLGNDSLYGNAGNDTLWGAEGTDTVDGGAGDDTLGGYLGTNNLLIGGTGKDTFCQTKGVTNRLQDYSATEDLLKY